MKSRATLLLVWGARVVAAAAAVIVTFACLGGCSHQPPPPEDAAADVAADAVADAGTDACVVGWVWDLESSTCREVLKPDCLAGQTDHWAPSEGWVCCRDVAWDDASKTCTELPVDGGAQ